MMCHKHKQRQAVAVCPYCGKGLCEPCLKAEHHKKHGAPHHQCRYDIPTLQRQLSQINRHNRLSTRMQAAFCTVAGMVFIFTAVVVGKRMSLYLGIQIGLVAVTCVTVGVIWWREEFRSGLRS